MCLATQGRPSVPLAFGALCAVGDVADGGDRERSLADLHLAETELDRELRPVVPAAKRLDRLRGAVAGAPQCVWMCASLVNSSWWLGATIDCSGCPIALAGW